MSNLLFELTYVCNRSASQRILNLKQTKQQRSLFLTERLSLEHVFDSFEKHELVHVDWKTDTFSTLLFVSLVHRRILRLPTMTHDQLCSRSLCLSWSIQPICCSEPQKLKILFLRILLCLQISTFYIFGSKHHSFS